VPAFALKAQQVIHGQDCVCGSSLGLTFLALSSLKYKAKANTAFKEKNWEMAIFNYTKSLQQVKSHVNFSNRSAAYFMSGDFDRALEDANRCIKMKKDYNKGYIRKGSAYMAMCCHPEAVAVYEEGLRVLPDDAGLKKGLFAAKTARAENSKANQAFLVSQATHAASTKRALKTQKAGTVPSFVKQSRRELNLQMAAIQAQLDVLDELRTMSHDVKMDLLFGLIDIDGSGTVDTKELATALRKRNQNLSFTASLDRAVCLVEKFDTDGDKLLNHDEFKDLVDEMMQELDVDFNGFAEFLVLQMLHKDVGQRCEEQDRGQYTHEQASGCDVPKPDFLDILTDKRLVDFFKFFDKDGSRILSFSDVAVGLYLATRDLDESVQKKIAPLLMIEKDDKRSLGYEQFSRLIMVIVAAAGSTFDDIAEDLVITLRERRAKSDVALAALVIGDDVYAAVKEMEWEAANKSELVDALSYARLQKLFDLWDIDGDGDLTLSELDAGLKKFQDAAGIVDDAKEKALSLLEFDMNFDQKLGRHEFAHAMGHYAKAFTVDLHELVDFMIASTILGENAHDFQKAYGKALVRRTCPKVQPPYNTTLTEDDSWSEDNFYDF
jgi:Ca2+-binding EF-hand superfamily protein